MNAEHQAQAAVAAAKKNGFKGNEQALFFAFLGALTGSASNEGIPK